MQHMLHQIRAPQFYNDLGLQNSVESSCKWQNSRTFQDLSSVFQVLFRSNLIFNDFQDSPIYSSTFQVCVNPAFNEILKEIVSFFSHSSKYECPRFSAMSLMDTQVILLVLSCTFSNKY